MFIIIGGAGMVGGGLAKELALHKHDVIVVDADRRVCEDLSATTGVVAVNGSATDADVLEQAQIRKADIAVAAMRNDGDNLAFSLLARRYEVPRIFSRMRSPRNKPAFDLAGVTKTLAITDMFLNQMVLEIERPNLHTVATFGGGKANIVILRLAEGAPAEDKSVAELTSLKDFPSECVIAGIFREATGEFVFPRGSQKFRADDQVFVAAGVDAIRRAGSFFTR